MHFFFASLADARTFLKILFLAKWTVKWIVAQMAAMHSMYCDATSSARIDEVAWVAKGNFPIRDFTFNTIFYSGSLLSNISLIMIIKGNIFHLTDTFLFDLYILKFKQHLKKTLTIQIDFLKFGLWFDILLSSDNKWASFGPIPATFVIILVIYSEDF